MANIFLSYNRQSALVAKTLADDIESIGHTVWFDHQLSGGQAWWDQILANVRDCSVFVFVLDPVSLESTACKREYGYAANLGKPILPILISDGVSVNLLPPALSKIEFLDYRTQDRNTAFRLARALTSVPPPAPLPDPLPAPPDAPISYLGSLTEKVDAASTLEYQEQSALLVDLRRGLRDPATTVDAQTLLKTLRRRRDLFATIAEEIDEMLVISRVPAPGPVYPVAPPRSGVSSPDTDRPNDNGSGPETENYEQPDEPETQRWLGQLVWTSHDHTPTRDERFKAAGLALIPCVLGFMFFGVFGFFILMLILPIVGVLSGMNRTRLIWGAIGIIVAIIVLALFSTQLRDMPGDAAQFLPLLLPLAGVMFGILVEKKT
jgi:hypothetical protein